MRIIHVVAAIIINPQTRQILATQRGDGAFAGAWEFPGGKIDQGETPEEALIREIKEELNVNIEISRFYANVEFDYPRFHLSMKCFIVKISSGVIELTEHMNALWLNQEDLFTVKWLPADEDLVSTLKEDSAIWE